MSVISDGPSPSFKWPQWDLTESETRARGTCPSSDKRDKLADINKRLGPATNVKGISQHAGVQNIFDFSRLKALS